DEENAGKANQHDIEHGAAGNGPGVEAAAHLGDDAQPLMAEQQPAHDGSANHETQRGKQPNSPSDDDKHRDFEQRQADENQSDQTGQRRVLLAVMSTFGLNKMQLPPS